MTWFCSHSPAMSGLDCNPGEPNQPLTYPMAKILQIKKSTRVVVFLIRVFGVREGGLNGYQILGKQDLGNGHSFNRVSVDPNFVVRT